MTSKSKQKGTYHENYFVKLFKEWGIKVRKQPLSGALGGEYSGDLVVTIGGEDYITEVKYRKEKGFPSPFTVLKNRDVALFKLGQNEEGSPKWVLIVPDYIVEKIIKDNTNADI
tara:strand:+ start:13691 stop:14032 length:342 start_codon:yes stop_codon:yes gene_type:complete